MCDFKALLLDIKEDMSFKYCIGESPEGAAFFEPGFLDGDFLDGDFLHGFSVVVKDVSFFRVASLEEEVDLDFLFDAFLTAEAKMELKAFELGLGI